jgi:predicted DNA-binding transcriptional regulator YafY
MLLQISNSGTLDSLSLSNGQPANLTIYFIAGIVACGLILYFLIRKRSVKSKNYTSDQTTVSTSSEINTPPTKTNIPKTEIKQEPELKKDITKSIAVKKPIDKKTEEKIPVVVIPEPAIVKPEKEEQSKEKYIGYNPINIFAQSEPLNFPYVIMPKANCVIKFPRKGRVGRKGYKEADFKTYADKYFKNAFQVFDDRFILIKNSAKPFEPDFTLIDEKNGINIFLDIEIDEPYEGLNDINKRKATHFQYSDINRNNAFKNRGWIVIRFAEIQVHQEPNSCCRFLADVIRSIHPQFTIPASLNNVKQVQPVKQWIKEEAELWSNEKYREKYLGIRSFGVTVDNQTLEGVAETELGEKIEEKVVEEKQFIPPPIQKSPNPKADLINLALQSNKYLSFIYHGAATIAKPIRTIEGTLTAFCYVKNRERSFNIYEISNLHLKNSYFTLRLAGPAIGLDMITNAVNTGINYQKHIRMKYTRAAWANMFVDQETGELIQDRVEAEESIRTINNIQLAVNVLAQEQIVAYNLDNNYITAYCNRREEQRIFRFDRIGEIEILDI